MVKWYLATYRNGAFVSDLGIIKPDGDYGDYVYKLKNGIQSTKSPVKSDWLRISITDNKVEEWDNSNWADPDEGVTGLVNGSIYWVYGKPYSYKIVTDDQTYYLETLGTLDTIGKTNITSVIIGNSVTSIGNEAFASCIRLASVTIPDSVTSIGDNAFYGCENLASVTIPNSVTEIGDYAFQYCSSLASVTIPNSVTEIGDYAFDNCSSLAFVTIPDSVTEIGDNAFYGIGENINGNTLITISQSTVRRLMESDTYDSGNQYTGETFFTSSPYETLTETKVTLNVI